MTEVMTPKSAIAVYDPIKVRIEEYKASNASLVFLYDTDEGNKNARSYIRKMRITKGDVARAKDAATEGAKAYIKAVNDTGAMLTYELDKMIAVHQQPLDEIERLAREKAEAEAQRIADEAAEKIRVQQALDEELRDIERHQAAKVAKELADLKAQQERERIAREAADKARVDAEAKIERERVASAKREKDAQDAALAAERAKLAAERAAVEAERKAIQDAKDADARAEAAKAEAARKAKELAEKVKADKIAAEAKAKADAKAAAEKAVADEQRRQREAKEAEERAAAERAKNAELREALISEVGNSIADKVANLPRGFARALAELMLDGKIARVSVRTN